MNPESGIMKKAKSLKSFAMLLGIGLALVSTVFTVKLMITFGTSGSDKLLYAAFGFLIQSAQTALYVYAAYALWVLKDTGKSIPGFALFIMLFFLSLAGSIGSFVVSNRAQNFGIEKNEKIKATYDSELASIDKDASSVNKQLEGLKAKGVVTKAKGTEEKSEALAGKRSSLYEGKRNVIASESTEDPDALYKILGEFFGIAPNSAKMLLFTLYAVALELASVILLSYSMIMFGTESAGGYSVSSVRPHGQGFMVEGDFSIPRSAFGSAPAFAHREPEPIPEPVKPEKKVGFVPPKASDGIAESLERIKAGLKQKPATGPSTGYSNKAAKPDAIKFSSPVPDPVTRTGTGTGIPVPDPEPVAGMKLKIKTPVSVPDENEDGDDMDIDDLTRQYIEASFPVKSDGSLTGWGKIAKKLGISDDIARMIRSRLKKAGLIRVDGSKTFPEKTQAEMIQAVS